MSLKVSGNMKRFLLITCILLVLITLSACVDYYAGRRPYDYGRAMWISESPDAWFMVTSEDDENFIYPKGEITIDDKTIEFTLSFGHDNVAFFTDENEDDILRGSCKFGPEKLIITVDKDKDTIFNGQYDTITFIREPIG